MRSNFGYTHHNSVSTAQDWSSLPKTGLELPTVPRDIFVEDANYHRPPRRPSCMAVVPSAFDSSDSTSSFIFLFSAVRPYSTCHLLAVLRNIRTPVLHEMYMNWSSCTLEAFMCVKTRTSKYMYIAACQFLCGCSSKCDYSNNQCSLRGSWDLRKFPRT